MAQSGLEQEALILKIREFKSRPALSCLVAHLGGGARLLPETCEVRILDQTCGPVAQSGLEREAFNLNIAGSNPARPSSTTAAVVEQRYNKQSNLPLRGLRLDSQVWDGAPLKMGQSSVQIRVEPSRVATDVVSDD